MEENAETLEKRGQPGSRNWGVGITLGGRWRKDPTRVTRRENWDFIAWVDEARRDEKTIMDVVDLWFSETLENRANPRTNKAKALSSP